MNTLEIKKRGRPPTRRILTPAENKGINEQLSQHKAMMTETEYNYPSASVPEEQRKIKTIEKVQAQGQRDSLSEHQKIALEKEKLELKEWLSKHMVPRSHIGLRPQSGGVQNPEFRKTATFMAHGEMSAEFQKVAERYKYVCRELGQDDDSNLEEIRPETN